VRILIFNWKDLTHPAAGGAEVFTEQVAQALVARGHSVTLFAAAVEGRPDRELVEGVEIVRRGGRLGVYRAARRFWSQQPRGSYDIVIDGINTRPFLCPRWIRDTPVVAVIYQLAREIWSYETPFPVSVLGRYLLEPWWLRTYRGVPALTISASSAESLVRHHKWRDVTVVPMGATTHPVPQVSKERDPTLVFLGRFVAMKRPQDAIEAYRLLVRRFPSARLWMIGDGPLLARLRKVGPPGVTLLGRVGRDEVLDRLARAHVLVSTSVREGWGLNVSEAAACGTPSIAYSVPGLVDSVEASGGALVDPNPEALGEALADYFSGRIDLQPRLSTVPWAEVGEAVERRLNQVVREAHAPTDRESEGQDHATSRRRVRRRKRA
jgi:glycosyltransferase involved in cell wall biosynthesis